MEILLKKQNGIVRIFEWFGEFGLFVVRTFRAGISSRYQVNELVRQMDEIGSKSIALAVCKYLIENIKLDENRIKTKGFGEQISRDKDVEPSHVEILVFSQNPDLRASSK